MTQESYRHPITPPPELVQQWIDANRTWLRGIALEAAQWGADQELEACCEWLKDFPHFIGIEEQLRAARRPKPPSLKEHLLQMVDHVSDVADKYQETQDAIADLRRALEQLPDNE